MRKKSIVLLLVVFMLLNVTTIGIFFTSGKKTVEFPNYQPIKAGPEFRDAEFKTKFEYLEPELELSTNSLRTADVVGSHKVYATIDWYNGYYVFTWFDLLYLDEGVEIWVQSNLGWPAGDPRPYPVIEYSQLEYLAGEFNSHIYPTVTDYFGLPDTHYGYDATVMDVLGLPASFFPEPDPSGRNVILVSNQRDENYYDPGYPYFVIGAFSPTIEGWYDRNIISIDCYNWDNYVGGEGAEYEGTIAHEYQHLLHDDYMDIKAAFMNEGSSMFAETLCGYPAPWGQVNSFFYTPDNSLTDWGDQGNINILADYGQVWLWATYLADHYGDNFLSEYLLNNEPGIAGINTVLANLGFTVNFDDVFNDWRLANLIRSGDGKYNYKSYDLNEADPLNIHNIPGKCVPWTNGAEDFGNTITILGYDTGVSMIASYGTDYVSMSDLNGGNLIQFKGDVVVPEELFDTWLWEDGYWYSGESDLRNVLIGTEVYVDPADPWLTLTTYWDIEDYWDFGFVQVSTDGGTWDSTWTSLENEYTTYLHDPSAHPIVLENLPGLTSWSGFLPEGPIVTMDFDLSAYGGQTIHLGFRYVTDWATTFEGWIIYNAVVSGYDYIAELVPVLPEYPVSWMVTIAEQKTRPNGKTTYHIHDMFIFECLDNWGIGAAWASHNEDIILLISPIMDFGYADYGFNVKHFGSKCR